MKCMLVRGFLSATVSFLAMMILFGCGLANYPGQPGMVTSSFSKIDFEMLSPEGLWVYEAIYDNRAGGPGVAALVSRLYNGAQTYTSNARTNSEGTLFYHRTPLNGSEVQLIAIPSTGQLQLAANPKIQILVEYMVSVNEIDERNTAEENIFVASPPALLGTSRWLTRHLTLLQSGSLTSRGTLAYQVTSIDFGGKKFTPSAPVSVETSLMQNAVQASLTSGLQKELTDFIEANYPTGFKGKAAVFTGTQSPLALQIAIDTLKTAQARGVKISYNASERLVSEITERFASKKL